MTRGMINYFYQLFFWGVLMAIIIMVLLGLSLVLFLLSLFQKDPYKDLKEEVDQLTLQHVQETYLMKQRLKVLEEELLVNEDHFPIVSQSTRDIHEIIKNQVYSLAQQGKSIEQIASQSSLSQKDVYGILKEYAELGMRD
jgi:tRNA pseudouridine-54 N-methylase